MKILQVISSFPPAYAYGGPVRVAYEISKKLVEKGHEVTVYTTDVSDAHSRLKHDKNPMWMDDIEVHHFRNINNRLAHKNLPIAPGIAFALNKNIKNFDIIHIHEYRSFQAVLVHHYAKKYGVPYVLQPRGSLPRISKSKQKKLFDVLFGWAIIEDASKIIASSKLESDQYWDVFPDLEGEKIVHIPNGIDLETYQNLPAKGEFRKRYPIGEDEKVVLFLSRIHERKGADVLIEAFSKLKNELERVKLVIAGPDEGYLDRLKLMVDKLNIEADVIFPGPLYGKDKLEAYVDANVFVLPSKDRYESFGNVALEACACGTPTIVTNVCGVSEWLSSVESVDPEINSLYEKLIEMLKISESERIKMGEKAQHEVRNLSWENVVERIEKIYQEILEGR
ncbi:MAG: glycosyltransferase [Candidatus Marinimicrobia bacterium]|nr:glycosyltransferase [Candidatus Neomarinimicrobiota bacterium]